MRGIAALIVAYNHASYIAGDSSFPADLFRRSYLAVDFFFLLSGFVLARTYEHRMPSTGAFLALRCKRLWAPIAIGLLIVGAGTFVFGGAPDHLLFRFVLGLCFLPFVDGWWLNAPAWSIFFELFANFVHSFALSRASNKLLGLIVVACLLPLTLHGDVNIGQGEWLYLGFYRVLLSYCLGILIWRLNGDTGRLPAVVGYIGLPLAIGVATIALPVLADIAFAVAVSPMLLLAGLSGSPRLGRLLGALSFPLYAVHWPVLFVLIPMGLSWPIALAASVLTSIAVGFIADRRFRQSFVSVLSTSATQTDRSPAFEAQQ